MSNRIINFIIGLWYLIRKYDGLVNDERGLDKKAEDWLSTEIFGEVIPFKKVASSADWVKYQIRDQGASGSCVANTVAKMLEIQYVNKTHVSHKFSHAPIYINRSNKPSAGMIGVNALDIACKISSCLEIMLPSEKKTDAELDSIKLPANYEELNNYIRPTNYLIVPHDFYHVGALVLQGNPIMYWVDTNYSNWNRDIPLPGGKGGGVRHSVTVVDAVNFNGVDYLVIEDSWGRFGQYEGQRLITKEFFDTNTIFVAMLKEFKYDYLDGINFERFYRIIRYGEKNDEVKRLQDFLKTQGVFPSNQESTGYYGNVTARAVSLFQIRERVADPAELKSIQGPRSIVGAKTLAAINRIIGK